MEEENLYRFLKERIEDNEGYIKYSHLTFTKMETGSVTAEVEVGKEMKNPMGAVHGGCLFSICDTVGGTAAMTHGVTVTTSVGTISYLNPAVDCDRLYAEAVELKAGKTLFRYDVFIRDGRGTLICKADMEYYRLGELEY